MDLWTRLYLADFLLQLTLAALPTSPQAMQQMKWPDSYWNRWPVLLEYALEIARSKEAAHGEMSRRLQTMPGVGPITAMAIETFAPPMSVFKRGRDFAAWLGLVPRQLSTGGKQILGKTSKMGQRDIRRLLIVGAMSVVRWALRRGAPEGSWLHRMLARKPRVLTAIALANKMARSIWAMLTKSEDYRAPSAGGI